MADPAEYDVLIVGAGISGAIMAKELARAGKTVLILESGPRDRDDRKAFHESFLSSIGKLPNTPYPPYPPVPPQTRFMPETEAAPRAMTAMTFAWPGLSDLQNETDKPGKFDSFNAQSYLTYTETSELPFLSTYERLAGGTTWHWLGTSLRLVPDDFSMQTSYNVMRDWPLALSDLFEDYARAEAEIGVSANVEDQTAISRYLGKQFPEGYQYPMERVPMSVSDQMLGNGIKGLRVDDQELEMTCTPQGRNSTYRDGRPACQGNSSCIPICPIQAKYDALVTLRAAESATFVTTICQAVVSDLELGADGKVSAVNYIEYTGVSGNYVKTRKQTTAKIVVLAAHAIETVKILLMSDGGKGIANNSDQIGRNLMDHLCYLGWGLSDKQTYPYRGPRSGSGIETMRNGAFRQWRSAWRVDVGNVGWEWADDDPNTTLKDFVNGTNDSCLNPGKETLYGPELVERLNRYNTRMVRLCYLVEQEPQESNRITLSKTHVDGLGLPRPEVNYSVTSSEYTLRGIVAAQETTDLIFNQIGKGFGDKHSPNYSRFLDQPGFPGIAFDLDGESYKVNLFGAGHIMGTYRMGDNADDSVVNSHSRSWDHPNLYLLGSGTFPTVGTGNPTLTIAALTYRASRSVLKDLG